MEGDWLNLLSVIFEADQSVSYCQLVVAQNAQVVQGTTRNVHHHPVMSHDGPHCQRSYYN